jgi:hypothetical protein
LLLRRLARLRLLTGLGLRLRQLAGLLHLLGITDRSLIWESGPHGRLLRLGIVLRIVGRVVIRLFGSGVRGCLGGFAVVPLAQDDFARDALSLIADHNDVVAGALQKLREDIARGTGSESAEDAFIFSEAFDFRAGRGGDVEQNLLEAGVGGIDAELGAFPRDGCGRWMVIDGPVGRGWYGRRGLACGGFVFRCFVRGCGMRRSLGRVGGRWTLRESRWDSERNRGETHPNAEARKRAWGSRGVDRVAHRLPGAFAGLLPYVLD